jgi:hypothetical protein
MTTTCSICGQPCPGHADSSNPFCEDCRRISWRGNEGERWPDDDPQPAALTLTPRQLQQLARLVAAGGGWRIEETPYG